MFWRRRADSDFAAEIESHIGLETDRLIAEGMAPAEARAAARRAFGNLTASREQFYERQRWMWWDEIRQDLRFGFRTLAKSWTLTLAVAATIALGVGANTAVFGLLDAVILRSVPVTDPSSLYFFSTAGTARSSDSPPYRAFTQLRDRLPVLNGMAAFSTDELRVEIDGQPEPLNGQVVSGEYHSLLGVHMALGRPMERRDERLDPPVAVISERYWRRRFGADPAVLGRQLTYAGRTYTIIGVTTRDFHGLRPGFTIDVTLPITPELEDRLGGYRIVTRLKDEVSPSQARSQATSILQPLLRELAIPESRIREQYRTVELSPAGHGADDLRSRFARPLYILMGAAGLVLLLACANIANLLLSRGLARRREFALRLATGAGRPRLVRQVVTEALLLFACGAVPGVALAQGGLAFLKGVFAEGRRQIHLDAELNFKVVVFATAVTLCIGLLAALLPAWRVLRDDLEKVIREGQGRSTESHAGVLPGQALVSFQVALSLVLLVTAVTFTGTLLNLRDIDAGFANSQALTMSIELPEGYVQAGKAARTWERALAGVRAIPGVASASLSTFTPLSQRDRWRPAQVRGFVTASPADSIIHFSHVSEDYFETLGIALQQGRLLTARDAETTAKVLVINESAAKKFFAGREPVGQTLAFDRAAYTVAGVVRDTKHNSLREPPVPFAYVPVRQWLYPERRLTLSVAATSWGGEAALLPPIRRQLAEVDAGLMVSEVVPMKKLADATLLTERLLAGIAAGFGSLALLLAGIGLYGVLSYRVTRQRHSIGIRMALGASPRSVARWIIGQSCLMLGIGILCGLPLAIVVVRTAGSLLWGIQPADLRLYLAVVGLLAGAGLGSAWLPAWRAARVQPADALRNS